MIQLTGLTCTAKLAIALEPHAAKPLFEARSEHAHHGVRVLRTEIGAQLDAVHPDVLDARGSPGDDPLSNLVSEVRMYISCSIIC